MTPTSRLPLLLLLSPLCICHDAQPTESAVENKPNASETVDPFTAEYKPSHNVSDSEHAAPSVSNLATGAGANADHKEVSEITFDQRQNGTQNVRIHLDDVTLIVAPSDGIASLFGGQAHHAFIQNAQGGSAQNGSIQGHSSGAAGDDPYAEFDELISTANFLKSHGGLSKHHAGGAVGAPAGKHKKCTGDRCKAKR